MNKRRILLGLLAGLCVPAAICVSLTLRGPSGENGRPPRNAVGAVRGVKTSRPYWGSDPGNAGGNTLLLVWGPHAAGTVRFNVGQERSGAGAIWQRLLGTIGLGRNDAWPNAEGSHLSLSVACPDIPADMYSYPVAVTYYKRYTVASEPSLPAPAEHITFEDRCIGSDVEWAPPQLKSVPVPIYDPDAPPPTPK